MDGKPVARTTTGDVEKAKKELFYNYFHFPNPDRHNLTQKKKWGRKRKRGR